MTKEDYVSFETAKLLKEKGFGIKEETRGYYPIKGDAAGKLMFGAEYHHNTSQVQISAPTHQMAMKWLRNKGLCIQIRRNINTYLYGAIMLKDGSNIYATIPSELETYEEAVEAALKYTLENLI